LVAVNSFKDIPNMYDNPHQFRQKSISQCSPHIYALAEKAYSSLIATGENQSFVIRFPFFFFKKRKNYKTK